MADGWKPATICYTILLVLQHGLPQNGRLKKYGNQKQQRNHGSLCRIKQPQEKLPVNLLFFTV